MILKLFRPRMVSNGGDALYALAVEQARTPTFYIDLKVADRIDARFELYTLHVLLLALRLRDEDRVEGRENESHEGADRAQQLFDVYVSALDNALRELGVGDLSMSKKMRKLGEALYGRMTAYETALRHNNIEALAVALSRNVYETDDVSAGSALARYAIASRAVLAGQSLEAVVKRPQWAEIKA